MEEAIPVLLGVVVGGFIGMITTILTNLHQARHEQQRWLRDERYRLYADAIRKIDAALIGLFAYTNALEKEVEQGNASPHGNCKTLAEGAFNLILEVVRLRPQMRLLASKAALHYFSAFEEGYRTTIHCAEPSRWRKDNITELVGLQRHYYNMFVQKAALELGVDNVVG